METKQCLQCKEEFKVKRSIKSKRFCCSLDCKYIHSRTKITTNCFVCDNTIYVVLSKFKKQNVFCCSRRCAVLKSKPWDKRVEKYGEDNPSWKGGRPQCLENNCSNILSTYIKGRCGDCWKKYLHKQTGDKHPRWNGGTKSVSKKYIGLKQWKDWRSYIFNRDGYKCLDCGEGGYLEPHHIIPIRMDEKRVFDTDNGITLCRKCHQKTFRKEELLISTYRMLIPNN